MARKRVIRVQVLYSRNVPPTVVIVRGRRSTFLQRVTPSSMVRLVQAIRNAEGVSMVQPYGWTWKR
jgi:hypothetical protein